MTPISFSRSAALALAVAALAGCGSVSGMLGLERHVPDETQVVVRPPLTLPPDYDLMPPGTPTTVSADHEGAQSSADAALAPVPPKKEERGFFGRLIHFDWFGDDEESEVPKPPAPSVEGTPPAPAAPQASGAPASTPDATPPKS